MAITLSSGKELHKEPPKATKEVDTEVVTQQLSNRVAKNSRKFEYLKKKLKKMK